MPGSMPFDPAAGHVIGVHVEQGGSVAGPGRPHRRGDRHLHGARCRCAASSSPSAEIAAAVDGVLAAAGLDRPGVHRVLIATPGVIDPVTGTLRHARHLHGWESPGLAERLSAELGMPVRHGNDVNLAAVAEGRYGAAQACTDYALLWLDRGVGLGLVLDGRLRSGAHGGAGEIGYLPVPGVPRPRVDRGGAGAFQQLVGGQGMRTLARRHGLRGGEPAPWSPPPGRPGMRGDAFIDELADGIAQGAAGGDHHRRPRPAGARRPGRAGRRHGPAGEGGHGDAPTLVRPPPSGAVHGDHGRGAARGGRGRAAVRALAAVRPAGRATRRPARLTLIRRRPAEAP